MSQKFVTEVIDGLTWTALHEDMVEMHQGYWYLVYRHYSSFTAFRRRDSLLRWARERGLISEKKIPSRGKDRHGVFSGTYARRCWLDLGGFNSLSDVVYETMKMDNGEYTQVRITHQTIKGTRMAVVNYVNVNIAGRVVYPLHKGRELFA